MDLHPKKHARIAAGLAMSNLGHKIPDDIAGEPKFWTNSFRNEMENLCGHLSESEAHDEIFVGEAEMWYNSIAEGGLPMLNQHAQWSPWIQDILDVPDEVLN